jgi:hypothetical protein
MATYSVESLFDSFRTELRQSRRQYAPLQLTGRIEDYLVKDFVLHIFGRTRGEWFPLVNLGISGEQKVDIAILEGDLSECTIDTSEEEIRRRACVRALIEAKYLRNTHRICLGGAKDETTQTLKSLAKQAHPYKKKTHGRFRVRLNRNTGNIYGLVFASFVSFPATDRAREKDFYRDVSEKAQKLRLRYFDLPGKAWLKECYSQEPVKTLGTTFHVSLRAGLWRRDAK